MTNTSNSSKSLRIRSRVVTLPRLTEGEIPASGDFETLRRVQGQVRNPSHGCVKIINGVTKSKELLQVSL